MKFLTEAAWEAFIVRKGQSTRFDGDKFEHLVRGLLRERFPGEWHGTPRTRDGGKDVVDRSISGSVAWAECKMYRESISLQIVSNTLVMAVIESDVNRILFFSYSEMIGNAKDHLARYATNTGKTVQIFDAELLEELILSTPALMSEYFSEHVHKVALPATAGRFLVRPNLSTDVHVSYTQLRHIEGGQRSRRYKVPIYTPCLYELTLEAGHLTTGLTYELQEDEQAFASSGFHILNGKQFSRMSKQSLESGQALCIPIYLQPTKSGTLTLPQLTLRHGAELEVTVPSRAVEVSALVHPILIGEAAIKGLKTFEEIISTTNTICTTAIVGKSGVGKSRFADEAIKRLLSNEYAIHFFNGSDKRHQSPESFSRSLLCSLWRLPLPASIVDRAASGKLNAAVTEFGIVSDMVYRWDATDFAGRWDEVHRHVVHGLNHQRAAVVIDNVQELPAEVLNLLVSLHDELQGTPGQVLFMLAFTEDALFSNEAAANWLKALRAADHRQTQLIELPEFGRDLASQFFDNLFAQAADGRQFSDAYPILLETILDKVLPRPLDLFQFVKGLEDCGAIQAHDEIFTVLDFPKLDEALHVLHCDRASLLDWRMSMLEHQNGAMMTAVALTYFGALSTDELVELGLGEESALSLVQASVMRWDEIGQLDFYHPSLARHFIGATRGGNLITLEHKRALFQRATARVQREGYSPEWFGLAFDVGADVAPATTVTVNEYRNQDFSGYVQSHLVADRLLRHCYSLAQARDWLPFLPAITGAARIASQAGAAALKARTGYLLKAARTLAGCCPGDADGIHHWTRIIREAAGYAAGTNEGSQIADRLLQRALNSLAGTTISASADDILASRLDLLNRRCVTLKNMGLRQDAAVVSDEVAAIAESQGWHDLLSLSHVDAGYLYYGLRDRNDDLLRHWRAACDPLLPNSDGRVLVPDITVIRMLVAGHVASLELRFDAAIASLDSLILDCRERKDTFYLLHGMAAKGCTLMRWALHDAGRATQLANRALEVARVLEDASMATNEARKYRTALYLQGKANELLGDQRMALRDYGRAAKVSVQRCPDPDGDAIRYDLKRLNGEVTAPTAATTFAVGEIQLPLP